MRHSLARARCGGPRRRCAARKDHGHAGPVRAPRSGPGHRHARRSGRARYLHHPGAVTSRSTAIMTPDAGVYVHLPFCPYICPYCDFAKWAWDDARAARYLDALHAELRAAPEVRARTLFFGGGTPTTYSAEQIGALIGAVRARFALPDDAEVTVEANPDPALVPKLRGLREA